MEDGSDNPDGGQNTGEQASDAGSSPQYVTAEALQDILTNALKENANQTRKLVAGMLKTQPEPGQKQSEQAREPKQESDPVDVKALLRKERTIERTIASHGLNDAQADIVRGMIDAQAPEDVSEFVSNFVEAMGIAKADSKPNQTQAKPNPSSDGGSPGMTPTVESDDLPLWKWSESKTQSYIKQHGMRKFAEMVRGRLNKELTGVRFSLTDR